MTEKPRTTQPMSAKEYVQLGLRGCPYCQSLHVQSDALRAHGWYATQGHRCLACAARWSTTFTFEGLTIEEEPHDA